MLDRLLLESDHLRKALPGQELHVEDLFHGGLELQHRHDLAVAPIDHGHAALQRLGEVNSIGDTSDGQRVGAGPKAGADRPLRFPGGA